MKPKPLGEILRSAGFWLDTAERCGHSRDLLHHKLVDLVACVVHRENCTPEEALHLLRAGYVTKAIEDAINGQTPTRRHQAAATEECNRE